MPSEVSLTPRFSLRVTGMVVLIFPVLALLAVAVGVLSLERSTQSGDLVLRRAMDLRTQVQLVRALLLDAQNRTVSYLDTGDARFLATLNRANAELESNLARLRLMAGPEQALGLRISQVESYARLEMALLQQLRESGGQAGQKRMVLGRARAEMDQLSELLRKIQEDAEALSQQAIERRSGHYRQYLLLALFAGVIGPFLGLLINIFLTNRLAERVAQVGANAHRLATGQALEPLPPGRDEIAELSLELDDAAVLLRARERRLSESEKRFRELFEQAPVPYHEAGPDGVIQSVNQAECRLLGFEREHLLGREVWELVAPEDRDSMRNRVLAAMDSGSGLPPTECDIVLADGSRITVEMHENLIRGENGDLTGIRAALLDVTERRVAVIAARKVEQYAQELRSKNEQLGRAAAAAKAATDAKSRFLANMSHELRTPLNSIIGFSELMHDGKVGPVSDDHRDFLEDILTSARHLLQLINDILDLSKIESGKFEFRPEHCDLTKLVGEVCDVIRPLAEKKSLVLRLEVAPLQAITDPARFKQVLYNYVSNAVKFTPEQGRVIIRLEPEGEMRFRLEVEDNGIGIAVEDLPRLFAEFEQLATSRQQGQGTGLGLALTKRLVEAQGGQVGVRSALGKGSLFYAVYPVTPDGKPLEQPGAKPSGPRSILVVEDNAQDSRWVTQILHHSGYEVTSVRTKAEASDKCACMTFDAITLDLLLPDGSGWELLREIRSGGPNRHTPVVVISMAADPKLGELATVHESLSKPVEPAELLQALEKAGVPPHRNRTILVVDDDPATQRLVQATLAGLGYRAICRPDGQSALDALKQERPAAVLLDLLMPVLDGFGFLDKLGADASLPHPPVIIWTNKDLTRSDRLRLQGMAVSIMSKQECTPKALLEKLRVVVG